MKPKRRKSSKESAATLFNRYVWLADTIRRAGRITYEEINDLWTRSSLNETGEDMPLRTFHNHRAAIEKMFYINIGCDKRSGYVYYISQKIIESNEEYGIFQYRVHITYDFIKELFSCVNYVEVLKPESLRQEFAKRIKVMKGYYD